MRLYTKELVEELVNIISNFRPFVKITDEEINQIHKAFAKERKRISDAKNSRESDSNS